MTISSTTNRASFTGNGVTTSFSFPYFVIAASHLKVYQNGTLKTLTTHYTLSGSAPYTSGTNVQFVTAPASGDEIVILRDVPLTQLVDLVDNDPFDPDDSVERPLDQVTMALQRLSERVDRSFHLADSDVSGASTVIPEPKADTFLVWNSAGNALENASASDLVTIAGSANFVAQTFSGDGSTTAFTLTSNPGSVANVAVYISGVRQRPSTDYTVSGTTLTFLAAPASGTNNILAVYGTTLAVGSAAADNVSYTPLGTGAVQTDVQTNLRQRRSVFNFFTATQIADVIANTATQDVTTAIQTAIDAVNASGGGELYFPAGTYLVSAVNYVKDDGSTVYGVHSFKMKDSVHLRGAGPATIIKVKASAYGGGAFYRIVSSRDATMLSNASIRDMTFDGNKANQTASTQCSNIQLECLSNVTVERVRSINANGVGIMLRGTAATAAADLRIRDCQVNDAADIAIQASQFDGLVISGNTVRSPTNNGIDVYGEDGDSSSHGLRFTISDNIVIGSGVVGIFLETVATGVVSGNVVNSCTTAGITVNRINGEPAGIRIGDNTIRDCARGVRVTGDTAGVAICDNTITGFTTSGVQLAEGASGSVSYIDVSRNFLVPNSNTTNCIAVAGATASFITGRGNVVNSNGITTAYLLANTAGTSTSVNIDSFDVLPSQVGYSEKLRYPLAVQLDGLTGSVNNTSGPVDITITDNTAGVVYATAWQNGIGTALYEIPYVKKSGTLTVGTARTTSATGDPFTSATASSNNLRLTLDAANTYVRYFVTRVAIGG